MQEMILTVTDFGIGSPYLGQMRAALRSAGATAEIVDLVADLDPCNIEAAAHFLASQTNWFPQQTYFLCVVDPGVGSERLPVALSADGQWFIGPDNGLFDVVSARASSVNKYQILWQPNHLSATFHGRDLFAPVTAKIASGTIEQGGLEELPLDPAVNAGSDLYEVIYIDRYGNVITGIRGESLSSTAVIKLQEIIVPYARTFSEVPVAAPCWMVNSSGLVEIALNQGSAASQLQLAVGDSVRISEGF